MNELKDFKKYFDPLFAQHLRKCIDGVVAHHRDFASVGEHFLKLAQGGKRLRPFIFDLAYKTGGGEIDPNISARGGILPAQFAIELFHLFALIHDDIMDDAKTRHGVETIHASFDINQAILVGDHCLIWAMKAISLYEKTTQKELEIFMKFCEETTTGQTIDVSLARKRGVSEDLLDKSIELKTAKYTFVYPVLLGLSYTKGTEREDHLVEAFVKLGLSLGKAFQRLDDLSDILADQADFGKKPGADVSAGVPTHLSIYFDAHATEGQKAIYEVYRGQPLDGNDVSRIRELFVVSGAITHEKEAVTGLLDESARLLSQISMEEEYKNIWRSLIGLFAKKLNTL